MVGTMGSKENMTKEHQMACASSNQKSASTTGFSESHNYKTIQTTFLHRWSGVACAVGPIVTMSSTDSSFQNLVFWSLFEFSVVESHLKIKISHILNPNLTKSIPLNLIKIVPTTPKALKFSVKKSFNIQELLHRKSKCHGPSPCTPPSQELSKTPRT